MEIAIFLAFAFILGTAVGSFLNVVVERTAREEHILGRSYCESCKKKLSPRDLIPVISYIITRGRCRYCNDHLSIQYPLVEVATGLIFVITTYLILHNLYLNTDLNGNSIHLPYFSHALPLLFYFIVSSALIALFLSDFKYGMLFDNITLPTITFIVIYKLFTTLYLLWSHFQRLNAGQFGQYLIQAGYLETKAQFSLLPLLYTFAGSLGIALFFLLLIVITKGRGMGGGDVKLGILIGLAAGWPYMIASIMIGFLTGSLISLILLLIRRKRVGQTIPFGPFLIIGCIAVMFFGNTIINWYITNILGLESLF